MSASSVVPARYAGPLDDQRHPHTAVVENALAERQRPVVRAVGPHVPLEESGDLANIRSLARLEIDDRQAGPHGVQNLRPRLPEACTAVVAGENDDGVFL